MRWYHYVAWFFGAAFLTNAIPHFVMGVADYPVGPSTPSSDPNEAVCSTPVRTRYRWRMESWRGTGG